MVADAGYRIEFQKYRVTSTTAHFCGLDGCGDSHSGGGMTDPRANDPRITVIQQELFDERRSRRQRYTDLFVGQPGLWPLFRYEAVITLCSWVPGALGLLLRSTLYPLILGQAGRGVTFGVGIVLRHPHKIRLGDNVVIDDNCCLDAKGTDNRGIDIGHGAFIGRNTILSCKNGDIIIDERREHRLQRARSSRPRGCGWARRC